MRAESRKIWGKSPKNGGESGVNLRECGVNLRESRRISRNLDKSHLICKESLSRHRGYRTKTLIQASHLPQFNCHNGTHTSDHPSPAPAHLDRHVALTNYSTIVYDNNTVRQDALSPITLCLQHASKTFRPNFSSAPGPPPCAPVAWREGVQQPLITKAAAREAVLLHFSRGSRNSFVHGFLIGKLKLNRCARTRNSEPGRALLRL